MFFVISNRLLDWVIETANGPATAMLHFATFTLTAFARPSGLSSNVVGFSSITAVGVAVGVNVGVGVGAMVGVGVGVTIGVSVGVGVGV